MSARGKRSASGVRMDARRAETRIAGLGIRQPSALAALNMPLICLAKHLETNNMRHENLRIREAARRKTLWTLASLAPGHPDAPSLIELLDSISLEERGDLVLDPVLTLEEIPRFVPIRRHSSGKEIVLEHEIPEPWRERFLQASIGSTRLVDGMYATDWQKFLKEWALEMQVVDTHRHAISKDQAVEGLGD